MPSQSFQALVFLSVGVAMSLAMAYPFPQGANGLPIPRHGKDGYSKDKYFQYINVPAHKVFEWGYRRGNDPEHYREEYLSQKDHTFKAKVSLTFLTIAFSVLSDRGSP